MMRTLITIIVLMFLTACGQKGPLYLPEVDDKAPVQEEDQQQDK